MWQEKISHVHSQINDVKLSENYHWLLKKICTKFSYAKSKGNTYTRHFILCKGGIGSKTKVFIRSVL